MEKHGLAPVAVTENWQFSNADYGRLATAQLLREARPLIVADQQEGV